MANLLEHAPDRLGGREVANDLDAGDPAPQYSRAIGGPGFSQHGHHRHPAVQ
ncbi:hypothetical protein [Rhodopseudomonas palustris]|uniref:hypothetical protein n=1 Tax=Rhodopseudomonas palustris TaxID=1076 RepID=UPI000A801F46|nr:hypothetical protein [Rhodopseudomonas palustris]